MSESQTTTTQSAAVLPEGSAAAALEVAEKPKAGGAAGTPAPLALGLKDPQVFHWWFFVRGHGTQFDPSTRRAKDSHWPVWLKALDEAMGWMGGWALSLVPRHGQEPADGDYPRVWARTRRVPVGNLQRLLQARTLLDATYVRISLTPREGSGPEAFSGLRASDWDYPSEQTPEPGLPYLGESICLLAVMTGVDKSAKPPGVEEAARGLARAVISGWCGKAVYNVELIEFACGYYATSHDLDETVWVLLIWDGKEAESKAAHIIADLTPSFMLAWLKGRSLRRRYDEALLPAANTAEFELEAALRDVKARPQRLKSVEEASLLVTQPLDELSAKIRQMREFIMTLRINRDNLLSLMKDPVFKPGQAQMASLMVAPLRQSIMQMEAGLGYKEGTLEEAQRRLDLIKIKAEVLSQKDARGITVLLGLLGIFGVISAFDREIGEYGRGNALFFKLAFTFVLFVILWGRLTRGDD